MSDELNRVYEALQKADEAGNTEDASQLAAYARQLEGQVKAPKEVAPESKEKTVEAQLNDIMYPAAGAVAGTGVGGATTAGRIVGGLRNAAKAADPVAMEQARRIAEKNAVETWGRTQHRVPGMPTEKPGLYFGEPTYALEKQRAYNEIQKMATDPEYHAKVLAEQKPAVAQYAQRIAQENPTAMQKVGRFLGRAPMGAIAGGLTGLGAGMQASDAINRYNQGDKLGSVISGIGAAGTGLAMIPHPVTRIGGTAVGIGAEGLNAYIDFLKKNNPFDKLIQQSQQQQQPQQQQPRQMAKGGHVKGYADGGLTSAPTIMSAQADLMPMNFESPVAFASQGSPVDISGGFEPQVAMANQGFATAMPFTGAMDTNMFNQPMQTTSFDMPLTGAMNPAMFDQPMQTSSVNMPLAGSVNPSMLRNSNPMTNRNPFTMASVNPVNTRAPMNPFNPGFAAQRPAVMPTQPRPGMMPQPPRTFSPSPMGGLNFRGPIARQRVAAGLSQLPRKPMFRRYDEGGSV